MYLQLKLTHISLFYIKKNVCHVICFYLSYDMFFPFFILRILKQKMLEKGMTRYGKCIYYTCNGKQY